MRGALSTVWFDRNKISPDSPEHRESIDGMCNTLGSIIQDEVNAGIPKHRMLIGMDLILPSCLLRVKIGTFIIDSIGALDLFKRICLFILHITSLELLAGVVLNFGQSG